MTPSEIYRKYISHNRDSKYISILADLNGCKDSDINLIIQKGDYFNGELPINFNHVYKEVGTGRLSKDSVEKSNVNTSNRVSTEVENKAVNKGSVEDTVLKAKRRSRKGTLLNDEELKIFQKGILDGLTVDECASLVGKEATSGIKSIYYSLRKQFKEQGYEIKPVKRGRKPATESINVECNKSEVTTEKDSAKTDVKVEKKEASKAYVKKDISKYFANKNTEVGSIPDHSDIIKVSEKVDDTLKDTVEEVKPKKDFVKPEIQDVTDKFCKEVVSSAKIEDNLDTKVLSDEADNNSVTKEMCDNVDDRVKSDVLLDKSMESISEAEAVKQLDTMKEQHKEAHHMLKSLLGELQSCHSTPQVTDLPNDDNIGIIKVSHEQLKVNKELDISVTLEELQISVLAYKDMVNFVEYQRSLWVSSDEPDNVKNYNISCLDTKLALLNVLGSLLDKLLEVKKNG